MGSGLWYFSPITLDVYGKTLVNPITKKNRKLLYKHHAPSALHQERVTLVTTQLIYEIGYSEQEILEACFGAAIHDAGKIDVPVEILDKVTPLTPEERAILKRHAINSYKRSEGLPPASRFMARSHHVLIEDPDERRIGVERRLIVRGDRRFDGDNRKMLTEILAAADCADAAVYPRPYNSHLKLATRIEEIGKSYRGDPELYFKALIKYNI